MIIVHHLENSRSQRILWLLEELGVDYEVKRYERDPQTSLAPPELLEIHPLGKSPVVTDGDRTVAESGAIIEYVLEHYGDGRLQPAKDSPEWDRYRYWMHAAEGTVMPFLVMTLVFNRIEGPPVPLLLRPFSKAISSQVKSAFLTPNLERILGFMNDELERSTWFAGDEFTAADVQVSFPVEAAEARASLGPKYPRLAKFLERIRSRPAYQRALEKGGPYELMS